MVLVGIWLPACSLVDLGDYDTQCDVAWHGAASVSEAPATGVRGAVLNVGTVNLGEAGTFVSVTRGDPLEGLLTEARLHDGSAEVAAWPLGSYRVAGDNLDCGDESVGLCKLTSVAADVSGSWMLRAARNVGGGCTEGQLYLEATRLDVAALRDAPWINWRAFGNPALPGRCGAPGVERVGTPLLAARARADTDQVEGLVAWRDEAQGMLWALGVRTSTGGGASLSARGQAQRLGRSRTAPVLVARPAGAAGSAGYLVAHVATEAPCRNQLRVVSVPASGPAGDLREQGQCLGHAGAEQLALSIGDVAGARGEAQPGLALAWREDAGVWFARLGFDGESGLARETSAPRRVSGTGRVVAGPALAYGVTGFGAADAGTGQGGWFVLWAEESPAQLRIQRLAEPTGAPLGEPFTVWRPQGSRAPVLRDLFLHALPEGGAVFGALDEQGKGMLHIGAARCSAE